MPTQEELNGQLVKAAEKGDADAVKALLDAGADVNAATAGGIVGTKLAALLGEGSEYWTALMAAAKGGHTDTVKALLEAGADVHAADTDGMTALMYAAWEGHTETAQALLAAGANVNARRWIFASWRVADWKARLGKVVFVLFWGVITLLGPVCFLAVTPLAAVVALESLKSGKLGSALLMAVMAVSCARWLLRDAWRNAREAPKNFARIFRGMTALMFAAWEGHTETAQALLDAGADVNAADRDGETALLLAAKNGYTKTARALVEAGADAAQAAASLRGKEEAYLMLAGMAAQVKYGKNGIDEETIRDRENYVLDNNLLPTFETFDDLVAHLGKKERKRSLNI